jgi:hypothetical protein
VFWALTRVPWRTIITHAPTIVETARRLYANSRQSDGTAATGTRRLPADDLHRAVARLEEREIEQAALIADLAREVQQIATGVDVLRSRLMLATIGGVLALVIAIAALIVSLTR